MPATLSIITCTRDPREDLFRRVLKGVAALRVPAGESIEYLLVDSTSAPPLRARHDISEFLARSPFARIVRPEAPGLAAARRLAARESSTPLLIWFDDDNVPAPDYLEHVVATARAHPEVSVWGAGRITVEFADPVPDWVDPALRRTFQERQHLRDEYGSSRTWAPFFPVGSGLVTRRAAIERWAERGVAGRYTLTGRSGASLASGDDAQIIFGAVAAGEQVGVTSAMHLTHLIPASRCTLGYLRRLEYSLAASLRVARAECFPDDPLPASTDGLGRVRALRAVLARLRVAGWREALMEGARRLGARRGAREAAAIAASRTRELNRR
jgi:hypothetical protein